ncbi:MAG: hypothetical protein U5K69_05795 [Balneolaceae bacterium]|nr:hypothetical protein [Balneolaceae bacterium]
MQIDTRSADTYFPRDFTQRQTPVPLLKKLRSAAFNDFISE